MINKAHEGDESLAPRSLEQADFPDTGVTLEVEFAIGRYTDAEPEAGAGDGRLTGSLEASGWLPSRPDQFAADDVAVLLLSGPVPSFVPAVAPGQRRSRDEVQVFGPVAGRLDGGHVTGEVLGEVVGGRIQVNVRGDGFRVRPGFSGGPVWRRDSGEIVGVLVACGRGDTAVDAYLLDTERIGRVWSAWAGAGGEGILRGQADRDPHGERLARLEDAARHHPRFADAGLARLGAGDGRFIAATVEDRDGELVFGSSLHAIGIRPEPVTDADVAAWRASLPGYLPEGSELRSAYLVVLGGPVDPGLHQRAMASRTVVQSFLEFQAGVDLRPFAAEQRARLDADPRYAQDRYVEQRYTRPPQAEPLPDLMGRLLEWLADEEGHLAVVLAPFGHGKTFLLHELARRMTDTGHPAVPVLIRMRDLEQAHDVDDLMMYALRQGGQLRLDTRRLDYLRREGRIALLFDGFDELARRVTYVQAEEHFARIVAAAQHRAKIVITSRREHFLTDRGTRAPLARHIAGGANAQLVEITDFDTAQVREFLRLRSGDDSASRWTRLMEEAGVLPLAANPRMLELITSLGEDQLASLGGGAVTKAALFTQLVSGWLAVEHERLNPPGAAPGPTVEQLHAALAGLAGHLWSRGTATATLADLEQHAAPLTAGPGAGLSGDEAAHLLGSGSMLVRTGDEQFEFVHRSVWEWLAVTTIAARIQAYQPVPDGMPLSPLQLDLLRETVPADTLAGWAQSAAASTRPGEQDMALAVVQQAGITIGQQISLAGQDLRGSTHLAGTDLTGADLSGADLSGADLTGTELSGADLTGTILERAALNRARLTGARLDRTNLNGAQLCAATLTGIAWAGAVTARRAVAFTASTDSASRDALAAAGCIPLDTQPALQTQPPSSACHAVCFSPDGDLLATGNVDGTVQVWDTASWQLLRTLTGHNNWVEAVAWSPDGRQLATTGSDNTARIWDTASGQQLRTLTGHIGSVRSIAWSPDGHQLATGSTDSTARIWDTASGQQLRTLTLTGPNNWVEAVAWSPDGRQLATSDHEDAARIWDAASGQQLRTLTGHIGSVRSIAWSPDGHQLATGSHDNTARIWDAASGQPLRTLTGHNSIMSVVWSPDGRRLATGSDDTAQVWDAASGQQLRTLTGHNDSVFSVAWSPDGSQLATGSDDSTARIWDAASGQQLRTLTGHNRTMRSVAWSPDGSQLATTSDDKTARIWDATSGKPVHTLTGYKGSLDAVAWSPDGRQLATGGHEHSAPTGRIWDAASGQQLRTLLNHTISVEAVAWSPDGRQLATGDYDKTVRIWDTTSGSLLHTLTGHSGSVQSVAWSPDGNKLATASDDSTARVWDAASGQQLRTLTGHNRIVRSVAWSPDGSQLATASDDKTARVWDAASGQQLHTLTGHNDSVFSVAWSPDGSQLATASRDQTARVWDAASGQQLRTLTGHNRMVFSVAWSQDGRQLATSGYDNTVRIWVPSASTAPAATILALADGGWAVCYPDGTYKHDGAVSSEFFYAVGLHRFEPSEIDEYTDAIRRVPLDTPLIA